jgi:Fe-S cluster assembly ATPase SufC
MKKITKENVSDHVDQLIEISEKIDIGKVTILTGINGAGKSFIRKLSPYKLYEKKTAEKYIDQKTFVSQTSMEQRTGYNADWGALSGAMRDIGWTPTSTETFHKITRLLSDEFKDKYIVIDEPEIGMGEETVLGLANYINDRIKSLRKKFDFMGVLVITHSRLMVEKLKSDSFLNIEGMTKEQWLTRELVPTDLKELEDRSMVIFREIQDRINRKEKEKNS